MAYPKPEILLTYNTMLQVLVVSRPNDSQIRRMRLALNPTTLHRWFRDSCFECDDSLIIQVFPLLFNIGMVI
jgi:hypothetical protein